MSQAQGALIEEAFIRFLGGSAAALGDPPGKGEQRTYIVKATCTKHIDEIRKEADRLTCVMEIDSLYERGKVPIVDENQEPLFPAQPDDEDGDEDVVDE